jgi:copper chaperone
MEERLYRVPGMHCGNCERAMKQELERVPGVASVEVDLDSKLVLVRGDGLPDQALRAAITEAGYEAEAA